MSCLSHISHASALGLALPSRSPNSFYYRIVLKTKILPTITLPLSSDNPCPRTSQLLISPVLSCCFCISPISLSSVGKVGPPSLSLNILISNWSTALPKSSNKRP